MLERYIELHSAVTPSLCLLSRNNLCISSENLDVLSTIVEALKPFELATRELSADQYTSVSKVIPLIHQLQSVCSEKADTNYLCRLLSRELSHRFTGIENSFVLAVSTYCDPRFKRIPFKDKRALDQAETRLILEISSTGTSSTPPTSVPPESARIDVSGDNRHNSLWMSFDDKVTEATTARQAAVVTRMDCSMELKMYCNHLILPRKEDPLLWWKPMSPNAQIFLSCHEVLGHSSHICTFRKTIFKGWCAGIKKKKYAEAKERTSPAVS